MKPLRIFLLALLVLVIPLRGALAAVVHCMAGGSAPTDRTAVVQMHEAHDHHHGHAAVTKADPGQPQSSPHGLDTASAADACKFCAASCSVTPLLSTLPHLVLPGPSPEAAFPALVAPPPSHLADALDRPPQRA